MVDGVYVFNRCIKKLVNGTPLADEEGTVADVDAAARGRQVSLLVVLRCPILNKSMKKFVLPLVERRVR